MSFDNSSFSEPQSPEDKALTFELAGQRVGWHVDGLAIKRAKNQGHQLGDILSELEKLEAIEEAETVEEAANDFAGMYPAVARLLWLGMIRFTEDVSHEALLGALDIEEVETLPLAEMMHRIFPSKDEELPEGDDSGKE